MSPRTKKIGAVVLVGTALLVAWHAGLLAEIADPKSLAQDLVALGAWGYVAFILAYAFVQPFGLPGAAFVVAASLVWPWQISFPLSMIGTMAASVIGFSFSRFVARDWVAAKIPARFKKYDAALERSAFRTVVLLRLVFWTSPPLHAFFGISRVPFWTHFWASLLGYVVPLLLISFLGNEMFDSAGHLQTKAWPILVVLGLVSLTAAVVGRCVSRREAQGA
jgi:uncharacterized membrane protein YdjX (TVP38/TMEM64 family)